MLAPWIIGQFHEHRTYTEPYGGGASVLLRKPRAYAEIYNDLDGDIVNLFRVMQGPDRNELRHRIEMTPYARAEFDLSYEESSCPIERARRLIIRSFMGFGSDGHNRENGKTGFRSNSNRSGTTPAHDWMNYPAALDFAVERMRGVIIESRPAIEIMRQCDSSQTLHYVDPPYQHSTRKGNNRYVHEMTDDDHVELLEYLQTVSGMVFLSSYPSQLYADALIGWRRVERDALADGARKRTEVLWLNPAAASRESQQDIFS